MTTPLLLLSPDGSRDRAGVVTPTVGGTVPIVAGQYGQAWEFTVANAGRLTIPHAGHILTDQGAVAVRVKPYVSAAANRYIMAVGVNGVASSEWSRMSFDDATGFAFVSWRHGTDALGNVNAGSFTEDANVTVIHQWSGTSYSGKIGSSAAVSGTRTAPFATFSGTDIVIGAQTTNFQFDGLIESVLIFDRSLTASEVAKLNTARRWTWDILDRTPPRGLTLPY